LILWARQLCCKPDRDNNKNKKEGSPALTTNEHQTNGERQIESATQASESPMDPTTKVEDEQRDEKQHPLVRKYLSKRLPYLDVIKVALTVLVVFGHCSYAATGADTLEWAPVIAHYPNWVLYLGIPIQSWAPSAFMNLFFFISGIFTPRSFEHKTAEAFIFDKLKRLILPALMVWLGLGPLAEYVSSLVAGENYTYAPNNAVIWFIIRLCLLNMAYAFVMTASAGKGDQMICSWFGRFLKFDVTLYFWIMLIGIVNGIIEWAGANTQFEQILYLGNKMQPPSVFSMNNAMFVLGCYAGKQGWLKHFEKSIAWKSNDENNSNDLDIEGGQSEWAENNEVERARSLILCSYYTLPIFYVLTAAISYYLTLTYKDPNAESLQFLIGWPLIGIIAFCVLDALQCLATIILVLDFVCHKVKKINFMILMMMQAAYAVYILHVIIVPPVMALWVYILRSGFGINVEFNLPPYASDTELGGGLILLGWVFVVVMTESVVWPFAFFVRRLPILNQIF